MAVTGISLSDAASGYTVQIMGAPGVAATSLDVQPTVRAVAEDKTGAHGSYDTTAFLGAAAVSLNLLLYDAGTETQASFLDALGPLLHPRLRPALVVTDSEWDSPRQLTVRFDSTSKARSDPTNWPVQVTWVAPGGVWEATALTTAVVLAFGSSSGGGGQGNDSSTGLTWTDSGITWTAAGVVWPAATAPSSSSSQVTSQGAVESQWTARLYGPATGPKLANDTAGLTLEFSDSLVLNPGDSVVLDSSARTAFLNGDPSQPVLGNLAFANSDWWLMQPGVNLLRYYPSAAGQGSQAQVSFRPAWSA